MRAVEFRTIQMQIEIAVIGWHLYDLFALDQLFPHPPMRDQTLDGADAQPMVDAASVATPTSAHFSIARDLLAQGKHLLIEKPITEKTSDARDLAQVAAEKGLVLQVGHVERFNPVLSALEQRLTHPRFIEAHRLSPYPNRSTEIGVVLDLMKGFIGHSRCFFIFRTCCKNSRPGVCLSSGCPW